MEKLFHNLSNKCNLGIDSYSEEYMSSIKNIFNIISNPSLLKSHIKSDDFIESERLLRFSLVFNDLSLLTLNKSKLLKIIMLQPDWFEKNLNTKNASMTIDSKLLNSLDINKENPTIFPAVVFPNDDELDKIVKDLSIFIKKGSLLLQPNRSLFYLKNKKTEDGNRHWEGLDVSQFKSLEDWEIIDEQKSRAIPISYSSNDHLNQISMFEITIPYLEGISFENLSKILDDEGDLVSGLRKSIKEAISECDDNVNPQEVAKDIIDPKIDALNRKFKSITSTHSFKIAGAGVGIMALTYTAMATTGIPATAATIFGSGGLGLLGKECSEYKKEINSLKDDPFYFLWKCKNIKK